MEEAHTTAQLLEVLRVVWMVLTENAGAAPASSWSIFQHEVTEVPGLDDTYLNTESSLVANCLSFEDALDFAESCLFELFCHKFKLASDDSESCPFYDVSETYFQQFRYVFGDNRRDFDHHPGNNNSFTCKGIRQYTLTFDAALVPAEFQHFVENSYVSSLSVSVWKMPIVQRAESTISQRRLATLLSMHHGLPA